MTTSNARVTFGFDEAPNRSTRRSKENPVSILVMADFRGREHQPLDETDIGKRRPILVDRDNFNQVLSQFALNLTLAWEDEWSRATNLRFLTLEDFEPDRILEQIKEQTDEPTATVSAEAQGSIPADTEAPQSSEYALPSPPDPEELLKGDLLERATEATEKREKDPQQSRTTQGDAFTKYLQELVTPHTVTAPATSQKMAVSQKERSLAAQLRRILHHPHLQALEATWRSVAFLVDRLETDAQLKVFLLDVSKAELMAELRSDDPQQSRGISAVLADRPAGEPPWTILIGNYVFEAIVEDLALLAELGNVGRSCQAPFLATGSPQFLGCKSLIDTPHPSEWREALDPEIDQEWQLLRSSAAAEYLGLVIPRFLLRLPYGKDTIPVETLEFQEFPDSPVHEHYLWGNGAFLCACVLAQAMSQDRTNQGLGTWHELSDLPTHAYDDGLEWQTKPCAEVFLSQGTVKTIDQLGLMVLQSVKGSDSIVLARIRSLSESQEALAGRWR